MGMPEGIRIVRINDAIQELYDLGPTDKGDFVVYVRRILDKLLSKYNQEYDVSFAVFMAIGVSMGDEDEKKI